MSYCKTAPPVAVILHHDFRSLHALVCRTYVDGLGGKATHGLLASLRAWPNEPVATLHIPFPLTGTR